MNKFFWQLLVLLVSLLGASDVLAGTSAFYSPVDPNTQCGWIKTTRNENGELKTEYQLDPGKSDDPKCGMYSSKRANIAKLPQYGSLDEALSVAKNLALKKYESVAGNTMQEKQKNAEMAGTTFELVKDDGSHIWVNASLVSLDGAGGKGPALHYNLPNGWEVIGSYSWHAGNHTASKDFGTGKITMTTVSNTDAKGVLNGTVMSETVFDFAAGTTVRMNRDGTVNKLTDEGWVRIDDTLDYRIFCGLEGRNKTAEMLLSPEQNRDEGAYCPPNPSSLTLRSKTTQQEIETTRVNMHTRSGILNKDNLRAVDSLLSTVSRKDGLLENGKVALDRDRERERKAAEKKLPRQQQLAAQPKKSNAQQTNLNKKSNQVSTKPSKQTRSTQTKKTTPNTTQPDNPAATVADTTLPSNSLSIATPHGFCTDFEFVEDIKVGDVVLNKVYRCTECGLKTFVDVEKGETIDDVIADNKKKIQEANLKLQAVKQIDEKLAEKSGVTIKWSDAITDYHRDGK